MSASSPPPTRSATAQVAIAVAPEAIWRALTVAEELTRLFPLEAGENPDGTAWMAWRDQFRFSGRVESSEPQRYLRTVPVFPPGMEPPVKMATEFFIETAQGETGVRVVQSGFLSGSGWDEEYDGVRRGWLFQLRALKHYLERHPNRDRHVAWVRKFIVVSPQEAWNRVTGPEGLGVNLAGAKEGDRFRLTTPDGDAFEGTLHLLHPLLDFSGVVHNWNDALLRVQLDRLPMRGYADAQLWLSTYGVPPEKVNALEARWQGLLEDLFPEPVTPPKQPGS
jgi:uncharacterized protein YndB with AHSA1/START domain